MRQILWLSGETVTGFQCLSILTSIFSISSAYGNVAAKFVKRIILNCKKSSVTQKIDEEKEQHEKAKIMMKYLDERKMKKRNQNKSKVDNGSDQEADKEQDQSLAEHDYHDEKLEKEF